MNDTRKIFTLTDLGKSLRSVIERAYSATYWIKAEIARLNYYPRSGHCYPELVDKTGNIVQAQMRATLWAADFSRINKAFMDLAGEPLREGMSILFRASVTYHPLHGLSLQIWDIEPGFTLGEMALEKARAIEKLRAEGLYNANKNTVMPLLPKRIAIISVETSKGYHDFVNILQAHKDRFVVWHYLFPSVLQGEKAVESIISQLRIIRKLVSRFHMVAIIRGGGGDIGLNCYDNYALGKEIAMFPLPVITGIGHSTNETLAEMVAWQNKITPTDVAYFILERFERFHQRTELAARKIHGLGNQFLKQHERELGVFADRIQMASQNFIKQSSVRLDRYAEKVALLNPANILKRGYSITQFNGRAITDAKMLKDGDSIETHFFKGKASSVVKKSDRVTPEESKR